MVIMFTAVGLSILAVALSIVFAHFYHTIRRDGLKEGQLIGELSELRRRDEMNVRARREADRRLAADVETFISGGEFTEEELDV
jgi:hypothetical protein